MTRELPTPETGGLSQKAKLKIAVGLAYATLVLSVEVAQPADATPAVHCTPAPATLAAEAGPPTPVAPGGNPFKISELAMTQFVPENS